MNKTLLKVFTLLFTLTGCVTVLLYNSMTTRQVLARNLAVAHRLSDSKDLPKKVTLGKDSTHDEGEVAFDHETHSFKKYSPDGKTDISCAECHHTDQPKSALKPPLVSSERDVVMTFDTWKASSQKVTQCRECHFQDGNV